jgi:adenylylsulfate kinase-like enzyme
VNVLWLGGGCGAGKTTTARRLAYRFDTGRAVAHA